APKAISEGGYNAVVLQEQSTLPVKNAGRMRENVLLFTEAIRAAGATAVLYMTWARQHAPETQQAIADAYLGVGRETGAPVVPVGLAWQGFLRKHDRPILHDRDRSHPSPAGSYLAACTFLAVLFGENPVGLPRDVPGVDARELTLLQKAAWRASRSGTRRR